MKKLIVGIVIMAFSFINAPVMAASVKVPGSLCFQWDTFALTSLAIKAAGTLKTDEGAVKQYSIAGNTFGGMPVTGSGYVVPASTLFHATFTGTWGYLTLSGDLYFDLSTNDGTLYYTWEDGGSGTGGSASFVNSTACASVPLWG
jgi:hypothetical protein